LGKLQNHPNRLKNKKEFYKFNLSQCKETLNKKINTKITNPHIKPKQKGGLIG
jgi:hypothetical protein